ncbi:MAG TPA: mechanosensitive ion channel family protein [Candidatus Cloacimonas sp.]|mgnify:FL=1|nr:mechanosensitive ion channel family protein [Candidatus Cloacimonas sp.]HPS59930.1 mechanosensitive ion channel family protein [Candidatus Cloacimonas sp.]
MLLTISLEKLTGDFITPEKISLIIRVILILVIGIPLIRLIRSIAKRIVKDRLSPQSEQLVVRSVYYVAILILLITLLNEFGFRLSAILGAAGIFGVAIGFASQTSFSNIISGIFLISEKPFQIGDVVQVSSNIGTIESIDLLSIKLKTPDNRYIRVPNETMIKTEVINITRYPIRRLDIYVSVSYNDNLEKVKTVFMDIIANEPLALKEPAPLFSIEKFDESGIKILYGVWVNKEDYLALKNSLMINLKDKFEHEHITIPYPHIFIANAGELKSENQC